MGEIAIRVESLGKQYRVGGRVQRYRTFREAIASTVRAPLSRLQSLRAGGSPNDVFWALKDISFEVKHGEVLGIIGRNGAGKTTLLKILSRITEPTTGGADLYGRVGSLLEVGTGFHPELTGRENIYLSGVVLGMTKVEVDRKFDEIVDFAGTERFLDTPVKRYSSGMQARLAFSVAAHLDPEILLVDEVLAVGDADFQKKCAGKMRDVSSQGRTILLVSHNMGAISRMAVKTLMLEKGMTAYLGETEATVRHYLESGLAEGFASLANHPNRLPGMKPALVSAALLDSSGQIRSSFRQGEPWFLEILYENDGSAPLAALGFTIETVSGVRIGGLNTWMCSSELRRLPPKGKLRFHLPEIPLCPGSFLVSVSASMPPNILYDKVENALAFTVEKSDIYGTGYILTNEDGICSLKGAYSWVEA